MADRLRATPPTLTVVSNYTTGTWVPVSIDLTPKGIQPKIKVNNPKPSQIADGRAPGTPNTNPWRSDPEQHGGNAANRPTGSVGATGQYIALEWQITFSSPPSPGVAWSRDVFLDVNGAGDFSYNPKTRACTILRGGKNDTQWEDDYILGNTVYMYDEPGGTPGLTGHATFVFCISAHSGDGKTHLREWCYVDPVAGVCEELKTRPIITHPLPSSPP